MSDLPSLERAILSLKYIIEFREDRIGKLKREPTLSEKKKIFIGEEEELLKAVKIVTEAVGRGLDIELGKLSPQSLDLEEAVLGAVMLERNTIQSLSFLKVEHFYLSKHRTIWKACRALLLEGKPIDMRTVVMAVRAAGEIEEIGGAYFIAELTSKVSSAANVEYHARYLVEMAAKRQLIEMAGYIMGEGYKDTKDVFDLFDYAEQEFKVGREWLNK